MKEKKLLKVMSPGEEIVKIIKPDTKKTIITALLIITLVFSLVSVALLITFLDTMGIFYFFLIIIVFTYLIITPTILLGLIKMEYIITNKNLIVPRGPHAIIVPLDAIVFINERRIRENPGKIKKIIIKTYNRRVISFGLFGNLHKMPLGTAQIAYQTAMRNGLMRMFGIDNPIEIIELINNLNTVKS